MAKKYSVEFVWEIKDETSWGALSLIEQLRNAGLLYVSALRIDVPGIKDHVIAIMYAPKGKDEKVWASQVARRMRSFGIDAQVVEY